MTVEMGVLSCVESWYLVGYWRLDKYSAAIKGILVENEIEQHDIHTKIFTYGMLGDTDKYTPDNWTWVISHIHTYISVAPTINITAQFPFKHNIHCSIDLVWQ